MALSTLFYLILGLEMTNPTLFYVFLLALAAGVGVMFFERIEYGLISLFIVSLILYMGDIYQLYTLVAAILSIIILVLWVFRSVNIIHRIDNLISGVYLYLRTRKGNK
ncbi:hypothetical protein IHE50_01730 [Candidatus Parvarchaeota archaeon]|uniref:Uncharacterized protein n=1 Tax=Candidatus Acidifodinimicrobium mancum TaxID=2898728 RepID=A0A8T3UXF5_9ARCH|nr:hypothetical protein [Candidatus Acidifodinimicrobium mancum]